MERDTTEPCVEDLPGERARAQVAYHHATAAPSTYVYEFVWDYTAPADGPFCTDIDGNVLLDFTSHVGAAPLGYNNPDLRSRLAAFDLVDPLKIAGQDFYAASGPPGDAPIPGAADLMDRLTEVTDGMDTVFLSNSGAEAVENAIKICYDHTSGEYAVTFHGAFHGRTLGALSLNRSKSVYRREFPEISGVHDVPFCTDRSCDATTCGCGFFTDDGSQLRRMLDPETGFVPPEETAYVVVEPVQGEGGYRFPSDAFASELAEVVETHDLLLVADEIQSGMGRTGEFWASDHYPFDPDVVAAGKGLRVGATIASENVFPDETSRLSSTWGGGDVLACAQGALTIDVIREQNLLDNARERGAQFHETMADETLPGVVDVRGRGLMLAVEFDTEARRDDTMAAALERGLLTLGCGHKTLRILPPLDATAREIELGCSLLGEAVRAV
ncbi:class-III pyridoxal-phosphate-dependent aminotransferase [Halorientalis litorea]|jgi:4-aminobutyrate aminotransferase|uniref:class-III pyridoxal-phosphate-dependent aminotransferase n=1 Tax=Halorientalis litorea TaxID=2931977 RepID=UPI001FF60D91|nr:aminotransferase class III-fold pyridoxal phosphate-dependent enzyme [Halorientalis litorea]